MFGPKGEKLRGTYTNRSIRSVDKKLHDNKLDYRGEVGVILFNTTDEDFPISFGDRIAQIVLNKVEQIEWVEVDDLDETERGDGGFGHTQVK